METNSKKMQKVDDTIASISNQRGQLKEFNEERPLDDSFCLALAILSSLERAEITGKYYSVDSL